MSEYRTAAAVFLSRFPNASEASGWPDRNLIQLTADMVNKGITPADFDGICVTLLRSPLRERLTVPPYGEVMVGVERVRSARRGRGPDSEAERLRHIRREYVPPTPEQRAARRAAVERLAGRPLKWKEIDDA